MSLMKKRLSGFTLIEMIIALAIMGFLTAGGLFGMRWYLVNEKIWSVSNQVTQGFKKAQLEAIRRNQPVTLLLSGTGWSTTLGDGTVVDSGETGAEGIVFNPADLSVSFGSNGFITPLSVVDVVLNITTTDVNDCIENGGEAKCLNVVLKTGGQSRVCNPNVLVSGAFSC